jgi:hypothetical protein
MTFQFSSDRTWFKMPAYSAVFIQKQIEDGDKSKQMKQQ